jgi:hypothetical protein
MGYKYGHGWANGGVFCAPPEKHAITVSIEVMLTAEQIGRIYIDAKERGITVEEYIANEVSYASQGIQY